MGIAKTPGVTLVEKSASTNPVVEVDTAVPAFVGWTERAEHQGRSLHLTPRRIGSMADYHQCFGGAPTAEHVRFKLAPVTGTAPPGDPAEALSLRDATPLRLGQTDYTLTQTGGKYLLYFALQLFFQNGGGACCVVSAGAYGSEVDAVSLSTGVDVLAGQNEPTMLVVPEAVLLKQQDCQRLQQQMLRHCGHVMKNRVALLDVWEGYRARSDGPDVVATFREGVGQNHLGFGAAYYPWVHTTVVQAHALGVQNITTDVSLAEITPFVDALQTEMAKRLNLLPPAAAMAGICTMVDQTRGVWKAPANVGLNSVTSPAVPVSHEQQEDLNVTLDGKSINAIRLFVDQGTLVWGARTLDSNSLDWRYIHVRRTMIMLEETIRLAAKALAFEPNVTATWLTMKGMITHILTGIWQRGGLAGAAPEDAFSVHVGLGDTMTPEDILAGILRVTVLVALSRPAEFTEITLQQPMQTS